MSSTSVMRKQIEPKPNVSDTNGKIIDGQEIEIDSILKDKIYCCKIKYMSDGLRVVGFILRPKVVAGRHPVLIFNRAGKLEEGKIAKKTLNYLSLLASHNYVVLATQYRGNDGGEGKEAFGGDDINDVLNLIKVAEGLPYADLNRLGMLGYSRGGMMTFLAAKLGAPLKAAAVIGAPTDLQRIYRDRDDIREALNSLIGGPPSRFRERYIRRSAAYWPEKLQVPMLILHGEDDWRVNVQQSEILVEKLRKLGYAHSFKIFANSDHNLSLHRQERNATIFEWFDAHLKK